MAWAIAAVGGAGILAGLYESNQATQAAKGGANQVGQASAAQLEFEKQQAAQEQSRYTAATALEQQRYGQYTSTEAQRYAQNVAAQQQYYADLNAKEQQRYNAQMQNYTGLNAQEQQRYNQASQLEQQRYNQNFATQQQAYMGNVNTEQQRYNQQLQNYQALNAQEQQRYNQANQFQQQQYSQLTAQEQQRYNQLAQNYNQRYQQAQTGLQPFTSAEQQAKQQQLIQMGLAPGDASTAYMNNPAYQTAMNERLAGVQQSAANMGSAYSGARMKAAAAATSDVQSQFYNNYMNTLGNMANPATSTALANLGIGQQQVGEGNFIQQNPLYETPGVGQMPTGTYFNAPNIVQSNPVYAQPGVGQMPTTTYFSAPTFGQGALTMGSPGLMGNPVPVGSNLVSNAATAAGLNMQGTQASNAAISDITGMLGNLGTAYMYSHPSTSGGGGGTYIPASLANSGIG